MVNNPLQEIVRGRLGAPGHVHRRDSSAQITTIDSSCDTATTSMHEDMTADRYNLAAAVSAAAASVNKRRRSSLAQVPNLFSPNLRLPASL